MKTVASRVFRFDCRFAQGTEPCSEVVIYIYIYTIYRTGKVRIVCRYHTKLKKVRSCRRATVNCAISNGVASGVLNFDILTINNWRVASGFVICDISPIRSQ